MASYTYQMKENIAFMVFLFMKWVETYFAHEITWAEEKRNQLAYRLNWITFERARKLLQEGYVLLSGKNWIDWSTMLKWKYYQDTEENLISRWFVRKELLGQVDSNIYTPLPRNWWYRDKA
ncbi:hypothetical protein RclHR1_03700003 [Rhizophagus clarus]|uniref:Uncharacterized protein n=1 Tax=Rhizophagus clarus TaxID=94130 RepID=A0A2Z6RC01_9GLOM|nr:hypothetical protein RclHR1_03700003 [Rhizophagus clarus]